MKTIIIVVLCAVLSLSATGCSRLQKGVNDFVTYKDPQIIGGSWTVVMDGIRYTDLECVYWGSEGDETACFRDPNGYMYFFSGSYSLISEDDYETK